MKNRLHRAVVLIWLPAKTTATILTVFTFFFGAERPVSTAYFENFLYAQQPHVAVLHQSEPVAAPYESGELTDPEPQTEDGLWSEMISTAPAN